VGEDDAVTYGNYAHPPASHYLAPMRHLADPATLGPGIFSWLFLASLLVLLPAAVILQERQLRSLRARGIELTRRDIYVGAAVTHLVLLAGALVAARESGITLLPPHAFSPLDIATGLGALALGSLTLIPGITPADAMARANAIAPRTPGESAAFAGVAFSAGIAEEAAYRGVAFALLAHLLGGWWVPALVTALAFGVAHMFQGWRAAMLAAGAGLVAQIAVGLTGTLLVAVAAHIVHDLIAGAVIGRRARRRSPGDDPVAV
jgi:membrane protease YdiL (CAAX protease family)